MTAGVLTVMLIIYLSSPHVDKRSLGGPEEFGQFGDYIGGILNPLLGTLTVLIVFLAFRSQKKIEKDNSGIYQLHVAQVAYEQSLNYLTIVQRDREKLLEKTYAIKIFTRRDDISPLSPYSQFSGNLYKLALEFFIKHPTLMQLYPSPECDIFYFVGDNNENPHKLSIPLQYITANTQKLINVTNDLIKHCKSTSVKEIHAEDLNNLKEYLSHLNFLKNNLKYRWNQDNFKDDLTYPAHWKP